MRLASSLKNFSLCLATVSFLFAGAAFAQSDMVGVNVRLDQQLTTKSATQGQIVAAKLDRAAKTSDGIDLPRGTELLGKVSHVQASQNGGPASFSLLFDKAQLKDGKEIPVKVTILGAYPPGQESADSLYPGDDLLGPAPRHVSPEQRVDQEAGLLSHISMTSAVQSHNSGTFRRKAGNIKLARGTYLQVGVGPAIIDRTQNDQAM